MALLIGFAAMAAIAAPAVVLPMAGPSGAARVIFLRAPDPSALPAGISIDRWNGRRATLTGVDAAVARRLYGLGAFIVYPLRRTGCLSLPQT